MTNIFFGVCFIMIILAACGDGEHMPLDLQQPQTQPQGQSPEAQPQSQSRENQSLDSLSIYQKDILPIFGQKCAVCHRAGSGLPVWTNFEEASAKKSQIMDRVVIKRNMPPPGATPLSEVEIQKIKEWIEAPVGTTMLQQTKVEPTDVPVAVAPVTQPAAPSGLYCEVHEQYPSRQIKTNRILSVRFMKGKLEKIAVTEMSFAPTQELSNVKIKNYYQSNPETSAAEICQVSISDETLCKTIGNLKDPLPTNFEIACEETQSLTLKLQIRDGDAAVSCEVNGKISSRKFSNCRLTL